MDGITISYGTHKYVPEMVQGLTMNLTNKMEPLHTHTDYVEKTLFWKINVKFVDSEKACNHSWTKASQASVKAY